MWLVQLEFRDKNCFNIVIMTCYLPLDLAPCPLEGPAIAPYPLKTQTHSNYTGKKQKQKNNNNNIRITHTKIVYLV